MVPAFTKRMYCVMRHFICEKQKSIVSKGNIAQITNKIACNMFSKTVYSQTRRIVKQQQQQKLRFNVVAKRKSSPKEEEFKKKGINSVFKYHVYCI